jgi:hypothetical protein
MLRSEWKEIVTTLSAMKRNRDFDCFKIQFKVSNSNIELEKIYWYRTKWHGTKSRWVSNLDY